MSELEILQKGIVAFLDGLWWGLRDNTGALAMYEGYSGGFKLMGQETAERIGGSGAEAAAGIAVQLFTALGLDVEQREKEIIIKSCPIWDRILEKGLEYAFHIEEICWLPMLEGIAEKTGTKAEMENSLRLLHVKKASVEYKKGKAKAAFEKGRMSQEDFDGEITSLDEIMKRIANQGLYRFK